MAIHPPAGQSPLYSSFTLLVFPRSCPVYIPSPGPQGFREKRKAHRKAPLPLS